MWQPLKNASVNGSFPSHKDSKKKWKFRKFHPESDQDDWGERFRQRQRDQRKRQAWRQVRWPSLKLFWEATFKIHSRLRIYSVNGEHDPYYPPIVSLPEIQVPTGEDGEEEVFKVCIVIPAGFIFGQLFLWFFDHNSMMRTSRLCSRSDRSSTVGTRRPTRQNGKSVGLETWESWSTLTKATTESWWDATRRRKFAPTTLSDPGWSFSRWRPATTRHGCTSVTQTSQVLAELIHWWEYVES